MKFLLIFCTTILIKTYSYEATNTNRIGSTGETSKIRADLYKKLDHERYARHVQMVTESVIDHLVKEVKKKLRHSNSVTSNKLARVLRKITSRMKHSRKKGFAMSNTTQKKMN